MPKHLKKLQSSKLCTRCGISSEFLSSTRNSRRSKSLLSVGNNCKTFAVVVVVVVDNNSCLSQRTNSPEENLYVDISKLHFIYISCRTFSLHYL